MKKYLVFALTAFALFISTSCQSQVWKNLQKEVEKNVDKALNNGGELTNTEVIAGLKEALAVGAEKAIASTSKTNGYLKNDLIRIPFPEDAKKVKELALTLGMKNQVAEFEETLNRAAEEASKHAKDILAEAILNMTVEDGFKILKGEDNAATEYLKTTTTTSLTNKFRPIVEQATAKVELTKYWQPLISAYNKNPFQTQKVNEDLNGYVTERALKGLFTLIEKEEKNIRDNPAARVTDLLKKVFE